MIKISRVHSYSFVSLKKFYSIDRFIHLFYLGRYCKNVREICFIRVKWR